MEKIKSKFPYTVEIKVDWPTEFIHEGKTFWLDTTGKIISSGLPSARYQYFDRVSDSYTDQIWVDMDGTVVSGWQRRKKIYNKTYGNQNSRKLQKNRRTKPNQTYFICEHQCCR